MGFLTLIISLLLSFNTIESEGTLTNDTPTTGSTTGTSGDNRGNGDGDFVILYDVNP